MINSSNHVGLIKPTAVIGQLLNKAVGNEGGSFGDAMIQALQATSNLQKESGRLAKDVTLEKSTASLEETMVVGVKANISFQANIQVRNRVVQAYTDIMNMQI
ncbi:MAG: flagellar hook-basal body complex protein FliE [Rhodoferax sp.]|nr:flagellar hook-basal body complex protein FliE [Rhodoferax sp.]